MTEQCEVRPVEVVTRYAWPARERVGAASRRGVRIYRGEEEQSDGPAVRERGVLREGRYWITHVTLYGDAEERLFRLCEDLKSRGESGVVGIAMIRLSIAPEAAAAADRVLAILSEYRVLLLANRRIFDPAEPRQSRILKRAAARRAWCGR